jgi:hypothetical protein
MHRQMASPSEDVQAVRMRAATVAAWLASVVLIGSCPSYVLSGQTAQPVARPAENAGGGVVNPPLSARNANYSIDARLHAESRTLTGSETITWRNITTKATSELQFHLYWNAWRDTRSTFLREVALTGGVDRPKEDFSSIEVTSIRLLPRSENSADAVDLTGTKRFLAPDDNNPDDQTVMAVRLPREVDPGGTADVELTWTARVPRTFARTGAIGNFFFIAHWFPKLGVLQDEGWNTHQFDASTEFFSDYGVYDVTLTVPAGWVVGATGVERERRENGDGTTTHRYYQEDVHDFTWTTSPDYIVRTARFEHPQLPGVAMRLLIQPEHADQAERHFAPTRTALKYYGEWFGPYPYGHITIVDPAYQSGADGMEYPTLFTAGTRWLIPPVVTINTPEEVTIHEAGHQFFYGIVGTNEFEDAWMDEGINTYATARALEQDSPETFYEHRYFGGFIPKAFRDVRLRRETYWNRLSGYRRAAESDDPSNPSYQYHPATGRTITYNKTALWLNTMERWLGWPTMQRILATYFSRWQFKHPKPRDFFDIVTEVAGRDVGWFFDQVHRSSHEFDYAVEELQSTPEGDDFLTTVFVRRHGEAFFPVDILVKFADGEQVTEHWSGRDRWRQYTYRRKSRAVSAHVDPSRILLLDVNYTNNSKTLEPRAGAAASKWSLKWMVWLQDALLSWAFLV